jgi:hypothetical protein
LRDPGVDVSPDCGMKIGDVVIYRDREVVLLGVEPMSLPDRLARVRDVATAEETNVPVADLAPWREGLPPRA